MSELRLVPLAPEHLPLLEPVLYDPDVLRFTRVPNPPPAGFLAGWYDAYERGRADGTREVFAVMDDAGDLLGVALAASIDRTGRTTELGYMVVPAARGRGVATTALSLLTDWAFTQLGVRRIELVISVDNPASKAVAARCGYQFEGVLRSTHFKGDLRQDVELWSLLPDDPRPGQPGLTAT